MKSIRYNNEAPKYTTMASQIVKALVKEHGKDSNLFYFIEEEIKGLTPQVEQEE